MDKTKVGVIGVGYLGFFHAQKYAGMSEVELVGVADVNPERAGEVAKTFNTRAFTDFRDLLGEVEAVSIVVPTAHHFSIARTCIEAGRHVLLEKPMTATVPEADELVSLADERRVLLQVGHLERYNPAILAMNGYLTQPMFIESHRLSIYKDRGVDVDVVLDLMIHDIDIVLSIVSSPLKTIHAVGVPVVTPSTDIANARLIFENGCTANVTVSRISRENMRRVRIFQPKTYISVDYATKEIYVIRMENRLDAQGMPAKEITRLSFAEGDSLHAELQDFIACIRDRRPPVVSGREGRRALAVALEIMSQIREHAERHAHLLQA